MYYLSRSGVKGGIGEAGQGNSHGEDVSIPSVWLTRRHGRTDVCADAPGLLVFSRFGHDQME